MIISEDCKTGRYEEFVVAISLTEEKYILIVEGEEESLSAAMALKDMGDSNHGGVVYGFATSGDSWRTSCYGGGSF